MFPAVKLSQLIQNGSFGQNVPEFLKKYPAGRPSQIPKVLAVKTSPSYQNGSFGEKVPIVINKCSCSDK